MKDINELTDNMVYRPYQMYEDVPEFADDNPFPMYSYDRITRLFWRGYIRGLYKEGLDDSQVEKALRSKYTRWMFDGNEDAIESFAMSLVDDSIVDFAKEIQDEYY